jgi:hypothetical protein
MIADETLLFALKTPVMVKQSLADCCFTGKFNYLNAAASHSLAI